MVDPAVTVPACDFVGHQPKPEPRGLEALQAIVREECAMFTTTRPSIVLEVIIAGIRILGCWRGLRHTNVLGWSLVSDIGLQVLRSEIERTRRTLLDSYARIEAVRYVNAPPLITGDFEQLVRPDPPPISLERMRETVSEARRELLRITQESNSATIIPVAERE